MKRIKTWLDKDYKNILLLLLVVGFLLRLVFVLVLKPDGFYFSDTRHYDNAARSILAGDGFGEKYYRSPLYPVLMAGVYALFGKSFLAMRIFETFTGVLLCYIIFLIGRRLYNTRVGLIAAGLSAIFPHFIVLTGILYSTNTFTLLLALASLFLIRAAGRQSIVDILWGGVFSALAALTIPAMIFILPAWLLWLLFFLHKKFSKNILHTCFYILIFISVLTPWTWRNYLKYGRLIIVRPLPVKVLPDFSDQGNQERKINSGFKDVAEYMRNHPNGTDDDKISNTMMHYLKNPMGAIRYSLEEMLHYWALFPDRLNTQSAQFREKIHAEDARMVVQDYDFWSYIKVISIIVMLPIFILAILGLCLSFPLKREAILLLLTIFFMALGYSLIYAEVRYRIPSEPYILVFTAVGFNALLRYWFKIRFRGN
ncbi:glycosyltransferase family 39 protein [candidate division KSB1 bacterium]|nr:glycosyltransferase family 39 protein [candidate division KSB1 bacterium]